MTASHRPALGIGGGRRVLAAVVLCAATAFALVAPVVVRADSPDCSDANRPNLTAAQLTQCGLTNTAETAKIETTGSVSSIAGTAIQAALSLIGVVFLILMIYGGIRWMVARGETDEVTKAKDTIKAAITGIIIVALAFAITRFIIDKIGGAAG